MKAALLTAGAVLLFVGAWKVRSPALAACAALLASGAYQVAHPEAA